MKTRHVIGLSILAGAALGVTAFQGLHAQPKMPVYVVIDFTAITDPEGYKALGQVPNADMPIVKYGGRYIARTQKITALDGTPPQRFTIISFDSPEKAQAWYSSPEMKTMSEIRQKTTKARVFFVEGLQ